METLAGILKLAPWRPVVEVADVVEDGAAVVEAAAPVVAAVVVDVVVAETGAALAFVDDGSNGERAPALPVADVGSIMVAAGGASFLS